MLCEISGPGGYYSETRPAWNSRFARMDGYTVEGTFEETNACRIEEALRVIDQDEASRAARFLNITDSQRYILAHGILRMVLASTLGARPEELRFDTTAQGKPELPPPYAHLKFNLSHSGRYIAIAVARQDVGIDIEEIKDGLEHAQIAGRFFTTAEQEYVLSGEGDGIRERFHQIWVRKEAVLKASGIGLSAVSRIDTMADRIVVSMQNEEARQYSLWAVRPQVGLVLALAIREQACS